MGPGLQHFTGVTSADECRELCWERRNTCNYFTFYNQSANYGKRKVLIVSPDICLALSSTCHLFPECELLKDCQGCVTGPASCQETCQLPPPRGGHWYCHPGMRVTPTRVKSLGEVTRPSSASIIPYNREMLLAVRGEGSAGADLSLGEVEYRRQR